MNLHRQLARAIVTLLAVAAFAAVALMLPLPRLQCPLLQASTPARVLLLDPAQKHPMWIDAAAAGRQAADCPRGPVSPSHDITWPARAEASAI